MNSMLVEDDGSRTHLCVEFPYHKSISKNLLSFINYVGAQWEYCGLMLPLLMMTTMIIKQHFCVIDCRSV